MQENISLTLSFLLGLGSSFHCVAMCGGISSALSFGLEAEKRNKPIRLLFFICAYNFGRIFSYSIAGAIVGYFAYLSPLSSANTIAYFAFQVIATIFLLALGLHVAGFLPQMKKIEVAGIHFWKYLQPIGKRFMPANTIPRALLVGAVWGWLPCGLVYSVLLWTLSAADPLLGSLYMLMFGLGTMPSLLFVSFASTKVYNLSSIMPLRKISGALIITLALASAAIQFGLFKDTADNTESNQHSHH
jgi:uncharacterized protein